MSTDNANLNDDKGYIWEMGEVSYEPEGSNTKVSLGDAPHVKVTDVAKFDAAFPGVILGALNGTSIKVLCQAVTRRMKIRDRKSTDEAMQANVLNALRGVRNRGAVITQRVFTVGDKDFATRELAAAYLREQLEAKGYPSDLIEDVLTTAISVSE